MKRINYVLFLLLLCSSSLFSLTGFAESDPFEISDETLPVTLSSFLAVPNVTNHSIAINWSTQSESSLIGYHILRAENSSLDTAIRVNSIIIPAINSQLTNNYSFSDNEVEGQVTYYYWLQSIEYAENQFFGPVNAMIETPEGDNDIEELVLGNDIYANYPNPFNPSTTISYSIADAGNVVIDVYNVKGQKINRVFAGYVTEVNQKRSVVWNGNDSEGNQVASGIYFASIKTASFEKTTKMLLSK